MPAKPPNRIEKMPVIWLPRETLTSLLDLAICFITQMEIGKKTKDNKELKIKIWFCDQPRFFKNRTKKVLLKPAKVKTKKDSSKIKVVLPS